MMSLAGQKKTAYNVLIGKTEGKKPLERSRRRSIDNIKMDLTIVGWGGMEWIDLVQDRNQSRALVNW
jgi:hypothetical protein